MPPPYPPTIPRYPGYPLPGDPGYGEPPPPPAAATPAAPTPTPTTPVGGAPAPAAAPAAGPTNVRYLSAQEQQDILRMLKRPGWTIAGGTAYAETRPGTDLKGQTVNIPTGEWRIQLDDGTGNFQPAKIAQGNATDQGEPTWIATDTPDTYPKPTTTSAASNTVEMADGSRWEKDPSSPTGWKQIGAPKVSNPDVDRSLALKAQADQEDIDQRRRNLQNGLGYLTDAERTTFDQQGVRLGQSQQQINLDKEKFAQQKLNEDAKRQPEIDQIKAQTGYLGAQTGALSSTTDINQRKAGPEIAEIQARTNLANAQATNQGVQAQVAGAPTVQANVGTGPSIYQIDPKTGQLSTQLNQNYQPKTQAEIAARVGQLQQLAIAKKDELQGKISQSFTPEQANAEWQRWWNDNVESQKQSLQAAQEEAQFKRTQDEAATRTAAYTAASSAGTQAITAANAQAARRVGPGFAQAASQVMGGTPLNQIDIGRAVTYQAPDLAAQAHDAVNEALKHISPTAAQQTGSPMPNYSAIDINQGLNRTNYQPAFGAAGAGFSPTPVPPPPAPAPPPPVPPMVSSGAVGPWAGGGTPPPGTVWNNPYIYGGA